MHEHLSGTHSKLKDDLKSQGFRMTKTRESILKILSHHKEPISVPEILECLSHEDINVNKTTAYRELDFLLEQGFIQELDFGDRKKRYELSERDHHHHLICENCTSVQDIALDEDLKKEEEIIKKSTGFQVKRHALEFFGLCEKCRKE
ncbi:MAG: Fur family transcriptional regulator [Candidatus Gracilibacteria bacterium]